MVDADKEWDHDTPQVARATACIDTRNKAINDTVSNGVVGLSLGMLSATIEHASKEAGRKHISRFESTEHERLRFSDENESNAWCEDMLRLATALRRRVT